MTNILVVGGAGYIGSHMIKLLTRSGFAVVVLDDLSGGYRDAVADQVLVVGSAGDGATLAALFGRQRFDAVMHFASFIQVGESVIEPAKYYANNLAATLTLLDAMRKAEVNRFIFSSTAAVYDDPAYVPIDEAHPKQPINPYGCELSENNELQFWVPPGFLLRFVLLSDSDDFLYKNTVYCA